MDIVSTLQGVITSHPHAVAIFAALTIGYLIFQAFVGALPPLPASASYWQRTLFAFAHAIAMNWRYALKLFKVPLPPENTVTMTSVEAVSCPHCGLKASETVAVVSKSTTESKPSE